MVTLKTQHNLIDFAAPYSSNNFTNSVFPLSTAHLKGVRRAWPPLTFTDDAAPFWSKNLKTSIVLLEVAVNKGVWPLLSAWLKDSFAPLSSNNFTSSILPTVAAYHRGVRPSFISGPLMDSFAPFSTKNLITSSSIFFWQPASNKGVTPALSATLIDACALCQLSASIHNFKLIGIYG